MTVSVKISASGPADKALVVIEADRGVESGRQLVNTGETLQLVLCDARTFTLCEVCADAPPAAQPGQRLHDVELRMPTRLVDPREMLQQLAADIGVPSIVLQLPEMLAADIEALQCDPAAFDTRLRGHELEGIDDPSVRAEVYESMALWLGVMSSRLTTASRAADAQLQANVEQRDLEPGDFELGTLTEAGRVDEQLQESADHAGN